MFYEEVFKKLSDEKVDYLVIGGVALVLHGVVRLTIDLDIMLLPESDNLKKFVSAVEKLGYKSKLPLNANDINFKTLRGWRRTRNLEALSFWNPSKPQRSIDVLIEPAIDYSEASKKKKIVRAGAICIPIACTEDLIKLKKAAGRPQDLADIESLRILEGLGNDD